MRARANFPPTPSNLNPNDYPDEHIIKLIKQGLSFFQIHERTLITLHHLQNVKAKMRKGKMEDRRKTRFKLNSEQEDANRRD